MNKPLKLSLCDGCGCGCAEAANPLYKKSALFVGDSLCQALYEQNIQGFGNAFGWAGRIFEWNQMEGINGGISAASLSDCRGTNVIIAQIKKQIGKEFDYVIIEGGVNDAWDSAPIGEISPDFDSDFDPKTFSGALENAFKCAKDNFNNAKIGYIIAYQMPAAPVESLLDMSPYFNRAKEICNKWNVPYLDLYSHEDFNKNQMKTHTQECLYDFIHPNTKGYNVIAPVINDWMKTL